MLRATSARRRETDHTCEGFAPCHPWGRQSGTRRGAVPHPRTRLAASREARTKGERGPRQGTPSGGKPRATRERRVPRLENIACNRAVEMHNCIYSGDCRHAALPHLPGPGAHPAPGGPPVSGGRAHRAAPVRQDHAATAVGTLCFLSGLRDPTHAAAGPLGGAIFETAVLAELVKAHLGRGPEPDLYSWRTSVGTEVDFVVDTGPALIPIEAKLSAETPIFAPWTSPARPWRGPASTTPRWPASSSPPP